MPKSANSVANTQAAFVFFHSLSDFTVEAGIGKYFGEVRKITVLYHVFFHKFTAVGKKIFFFAVPHDAFFYRALTFFTRGNSEHGVDCRGSEK